MEYMYIQIALCLLGISGNAISVCVLSKMKSKSFRLMKYLSATDIVLLVIMFIHYAMDAWGRFGLAFLFVNLSIGILFDAVLMFDAYLTVLIAFVRCLAVAMPFRFATCMRDSVQNKLLFAIAMLSVLFRLPLVLIWVIRLRDLDSFGWMEVFTVYFEAIISRFLPILVH